MTDVLQTHLATDGYCVARGLLDASVLAALDADISPVMASTPFCDGDFYGRATKRRGGLLARSDVATQLVRHPLVLELVERVLLPYCDRIALNLTQAIDIHPGALAQYPHRDQDMWAGPKGEIEYLVNVMWPLVPFASENGGTRLWSGSHRPDWQGHEGEAMAITPRVDVGDALLFLGSTLHGGGGNSSVAVRRGVVVSYCLGWLKPFENQWLVYPPSIARSFDPALAALVGYAQHRPNLGNVEGRCPSELLWPSGAGPAADALLPDQAAALGDYVARQKATDTTVTEG